MLVVIWRAVRQKISQLILCHTVLHKAASTFPSVLVCVGLWLKTIGVLFLCDLCGSAVKSFLDNSVV